jgi:thiamine biosynthesis lipoprotein
MWTFRAMNTDVAVHLPFGSHAEQRGFALAVADHFAAVERQFSRFSPDSELARLNRSASLAVSAEMIALLSACRHHVEESGGIFDPTVGAALCAAGYDRSFALGALDRDEPAAPRVARFADVAFDESARIVRRPPHVQLDFGGFLKGRTADQAAALALGPAIVDAGGDVVARGAGPDGTGWLVEIEDPTDAARIVAMLRLCDRAVATTAANRRRWRAGGTVVHHVIDPRRGLPARLQLAQASVVAPTAELADVAAKTVFVLGANDRRRFLAARPQLGAVLVHIDGTVETIGDVEVVDA